jgi:hypothetical protein
MSISTPNRPNGAAPTSAGLSEGLPQYVQDFVRRPPGLLIDGEWVEAASGNQVVQGISHAARKIKVGPGLEARARAPAGGGRAGDLGYFVQPTVLATSTRPTGPPTAYARAHSGSTATACSTPQCRSAATRNQAGAGKWATTPSPTTSKPSQ